MSLYIIRINEKWTIEQPLAFIYVWLIFIFVHMKYMIFCFDLVYTNLLLYFF